MNWLLEFLNPELRRQRYLAAASRAWREEPCTWATKEELERTDPFIKSVNSGGKGAK